MKKSRPAKARPHGVPEGARYSPEDDQWELGTTVRGKHVGLWRFWRADGSLACAMRFDEKGLLHGEFARYHADGTVSRSGRFSHGHHVGRETFFRARTASSEHFPVEAPKVTKMVLDHDVDDDQIDEPMRYFDRDGNETTSFGVPLSEWRDDRLFVGHKPSSYLEDGFEDYLRSYHGIPKRLPKVPALAEFEEVWGRKAPASLARFVRLTTALADGRLFELVPEFGSPRLLPRSKNMLEESILADQASGIGTSLVQLLSGVVSIGTTNNGDTWHFGLYDDLHTEAEGEGQVYLYSGDEQTLCDPITPDLSSFAYLSAAADARVLGAVSPAAFSRAYRRLKKKVGQSTHFSGLERKVTPALDEAFRYKSPAILPRFLFFRGLWIACLLRNGRGVAVEDMPRVFVESANEPITEHSWRGWLERVPTAVPTALYILFRCFFFDDEARLAEAVRVCEESPARLVRDAAKLVSELQDGRKTLGTIGNVQRLKTEFAALELDPNRREQRERDRGGRAKEARAKAERVATARAISAGANLEELAWENLDDAAAHEEIVRAMRDQEEMRETFAILDYLDRDGHVHDNLVLEHEREEAFLALAEMGSTACVPILLGRARRADRKAVEMLAALKDPRAVPHLLALLDGRADRYHHFDTAVVHALRTHGARGAVPKLLAILARNPLTDWRAGIERGDLVQEVVLALGSLGDRSATPALLKVLSQTTKEYEEVLPLAAGALGALRTTMAAPALAARLERPPEALTPEEIWAYGEVCAKDAELHDDARRRLTALGALDVTAEIVRQAALAKLGGDRSAYLDAFVTALREPGVRKLDTSRQRVWAWRSYGELGGPIPEVGLVREHLTTDDHAVRAAATKALARQGALVPDARFYFSFGLDAQMKSGGLSALHDAVKDPWGVFRYNVARKLAKIGDVSSVPALCEAVRGIFDESVVSTYEYDEPPYHLRWFVRALGSFTSMEAVQCLIDGLGSQSHHVRQAIASDPPKDDAVVPALVRLLDDPRTVLRSRAQHALEAFKKSPAYARAMEDRDMVAEA